MFQALKSGFNKIKGALSRSSSYFSGKLKSLFGGAWDETKLDKLEQLLYEADLGSEIASTFVQKIKKTMPYGSDIQVLIDELRRLSLEIFDEPPASLPERDVEGVRVTLFVGINGSGKTTTLAKLAAKYKEEGRKVLLAAADTFRAGAISQLELWGERLGCEVVRGKEGSDPSSVIFDALSAAKARGYDDLFIDTAGRLQNKDHLMRELEKMARVCQKVVPGAPHETLLVIDATTGQNGEEQLELFHATTPLSGLIVTKLDGTAKGGILLPIYKRWHIPVRYVGTGESRDDLVAFEPRAFVDALFS